MTECRDTNVWNLLYSLSWRVQQYIPFPGSSRCCRCRSRMVVRFTTTGTYHH